MSLLDKASLIVTPNAYKESKLYSVVPSSGAGDMDVVRATTATRVNSAGLIEVVPRNLLTYSEQFDNAAWTKNAATISANSIAAPNGFTTADKLVEDTTNDAHYLDIRPTVNNSINISSIYVKAAGRTKFQLREGSNGDLATFDLSSPSGNIQSVGNDWYRVWLSTTPAATTYIFQLRLLDNSGNLIYTGNGTSGLYVWGAQLEIGSTATEYFPTTTRLNIPRIDYTNGSCPSLLVEPQRTNICTYSEQFNNVIYAKSNATITANSIISPDGTLTADKFESIIAGVPEMVQATLNSNAKTISFYAKAGNVNFISLWIGSEVKFNLSTGTVVSGTGSIQNAGNGWYRCIVPNTTFTNFNPFFVASASGEFVYLWGAQMEVGSYPTSYIPTVASSVTRNADVISKTGISSLIGQTEGTIFIDAYRTNKSTNYQAILGLGNGTSSSEMMEFFFRASNELTIGVYNSGQQFVNTSAISSGRHKIALAYKLNDYALYIDGALIATDNSATVPTMNKLNIGGFNYASGDEYSDGINSVQLYKTRLTNTELAQLTTL